MILENKKFQTYLFSFLLVFIIAGISTYFTKLGVNTIWANCVKSPFQPPKITFSIVWTILYIIIAIGFAHTLLLKRENKNRQILLQLYGFNLVLNMIWCFVYFLLRDIKFGFFIICILLISQLFILYYTFYSQPKWLFGLLCLYAIWLFFAGFLNLTAIPNIGKCA